MIIGSGFTKNVDDQQWPTCHIGRLLPGCLLRGCLPLKVNSHEDAELRLPGLCVTLRSIVMGVEVNASVRRMKVHIIT